MNDAEFGLLDRIADHPRSGVLTAAVLPDERRDDVLEMVLTP
jgi:hypothetical protein